MLQFSMAASLHGDSVCRGNTERKDYVSIFARPRKHEGKGREEGRGKRVNFVFRGHILHTERAVLPQHLGWLPNLD